MRREHFDQLRPICPRCFREAQSESPVDLIEVIREAKNVIFEGFLACAACRQVYPILDGIPLLVADLERIVEGQIQSLTARRDLSGEMEGYLARCCDKASAFSTTRYHLSIYSRDHYGDFDPEDRDDPAPGSILRLLEKGLGRIRELPPGPMIDIGCSVGRTSFDLAEKFGRRVLGVDLSFAMLRLAQDVLHRTRLRYPHRREGADYEEREFEVELAARQEVDFWLCDAAELPFRGESFAFASHLNLLDCLSSPYDGLRSLERILKRTGKSLLATPFDWSSGATPIETWLGGHSQRGPEAGKSEPVLRALLGGDHPAALDQLRLESVPNSADWHLRLDDRHAASYRVYLAIAEKSSG